MWLSFAYTTANQIKRTYGRDRSGGVEAVPKRSEGMSREDGEVWIARPPRMQSIVGTPIYYFSADSAFFSSAARSENFTVASFCSNAFCASARWESSML